MSDLSGTAALMQTLSAAYAADLAISPMIVVAGSDSRDLETGWPGTNKIIGRACDIAGYFTMAYWVRKDMMDQLAEDARHVLFDEDTATRIAILNMQSIEGDDMLEDMLSLLRETAVRTYVAVIVVRPDQVDDVRKSVTTALQVPAPLIPTWWQDANLDPREIQIVGEAMLVGRINGYNFVSAKIAEPYPHEVEIVILTDKDDDEASDYGLDAVIDKFDEHANFATPARMQDGRFVSRLDDVVIL